MPKSGNFAVEMIEKEYSSEKKNIKTAEFAYIVLKI